jgi:hypothetical protein
MNTFVKIKNIEDMLSILSLWIVVLREEQNGRPMTLLYSM